MHLKRFQDAVDSSNERLRTHSTDTYALGQKAQALIELECHKEALDVLGEGVVVDSEDIVLWWLMAKAAYFGGDDYSNFLQDSLRNIERIEPGRNTLAALKRLEEKQVHKKIHVFDDTKWEVLENDHPRVFDSTRGSYPLVVDFD